MAVPPFSQGVSIRPPLATYGAGRDGFWPHRCLGSTLDHEARDRVRHFSSHLVDLAECQHASLPHGRFGRGIELCRSIPGLGERRRVAAPIRIAWDVQRVALDRESGRTVASSATWVPAVGAGLSADKVP